MQTELYETLAKCQDAEQASALVHCQRQAAHISTCPSGCEVFRSNNTLLAEGLHWYGHTQSSRQSSNAANEDSLWRQILSVNDPWSAVAAQSTTVPEKGLTVGGRGGFLGWIAVSSSFSLRLVTGLIVRDRELWLASYLFLEIFMSWWISWMFDIITIQVDCSWCTLIYSSEPCVRTVSWFV